MLLMAPPKRLELGRSSTRTTMIQPRVSVFCLGKLGAAMAAAMASRGLPVVAVDLNQEAVEAVNRGRSPVEETNLAALIAANRSRLRATSDHIEAVLESDVTFVVVPTPSDASGAFSLECARAAFSAIGKAMKAKDSYHLVVLVSTVLPGATRHGLLPVLEDASGKRSGVDFGLCYSPVFVALGSVIHDFLNPDFHLVGELDQRSGDTLSTLLAQLVPGEIPCQRMSIENAEIVKISVNSFVTMKISFANLIAEFCGRIPGADVDVVSAAVGLDRRIGRRYLTGGLGFGGPCFPRDNVALSFACGSVGVPTELLEATDHFNRSHPARMMANLEAVLPPAGGLVVVLGLAYKPHTTVVEESPGVHLALRLAEAGYRVRGHDPMANAEAKAALDGKAEVVDSLKECLEGAETVLVTTPDPAFQSLSADHFQAGGKKVVVVDFWRCLGKAITGHPNIRYVPLGRSVGSAASEGPPWVRTATPRTRTPKEPILQPIE